MTETCRALVTGASGFIGSRLVQRLVRDGMEVRALVRVRSRAPSWGKAVEVVDGDIQDEATMKGVAEGMDAVFHLAGKAHAVSELRDDEREYQSAHVAGTRNILGSAAAARCRSFVYFSSVKAMGEESPECRDESCAPRPETAYGRAKLEAERLVLGRGAEAGLKATCLRLPLVYGPGSKGNLQRMLRAIDRGFFPPIADSGNRRSMVHLENVIDAALLAADHPSSGGRCYIVTDARPYSTREIYELLCRGLGKRPPVWSIPPGLIRRLGVAGDLIGKMRGKRFLFDSSASTRLLGSAWFSSELISKELGYRPRLGFEDAVAEMVSDLRAGATV